MKLIWDSLILTKFRNRNLFLSLLPSSKNWRTWQRLMVTSNSPQVVVSCSSDYSVIILLETPLEPSTLSATHADQTKRSRYFTSMIFLQSGICAYSKSHHNYIIRELTWIYRIIQASLLWTVVDWNQEMKYKPCTHLRNALDYWFDRFNKNRLKWAFNSAHPIFILDHHLMICGFWIPAQVLSLHLFVFHLGKWNVEPINISCLSLGKKIHTSKNL